VNFHFYLFRDRTAIELDGKRLPPLKPLIFDVCTFVAGMTLPINLPVIAAWTSMDRGGSDGIGRSGAVFEAQLSFPGLDDVAVTGERVEERGGRLGGRRTRSATR
jgi:hypothetical protein